MSTFRRGWHSLTQEVVLHQELGATTGLSRCMPRCRTSTGSTTRSSAERSSRNAHCADYSHYGTASLLRIRILLVPAGVTTGKLVRLLATRWTTSPASPTLT